jgi:hypothetical protein
MRSGANGHLEHLHSDAPLLSCAQASVAELTCQTLAPDATD